MQGVEHIINFHSFVSYLGLH